MKYCFLAIFSLIFLLPGNAFAGCECPEDEKLETVLNNSTIVFVGRVEKQGSTALRPKFSEVNLSVLRKFKWLDEIPKKNTVVVYTPKLKEECGVKFRNGFEYLIFAQGNPAFLKTSVCDKTDILEKAKLNQQKLIRLVE